MKVVFKIIKAGSGNDVYFKRLAEALNIAGIETQIIYYPKFYQYFPLLLKLVDKKVKADIIHSNVEYGWVFKEKGKPLVVSLLHSVFDEQYQKHVSVFQRMYYKFILKPNTRITMKIADRRIAISEFTKKAFLSDFGDYKIDVIYPSLNTDVFRPLKVKSTDRRFKLLFVGNLTKRKGADLLPKIMEKLGNKYVLYYTSGLRSKIPKEFVKENMIPLGKLTEEELVEEYNKCDALLFPTRLEGFGYCVAEAMACGKPVFATNCTALPELIRDWENGRLCKFNSFSDFVIKIKTTRFDHELSNKNVQKIKRIFSNHVISRHYKNVLGVSKYETF